MPPYVPRKRLRDTPPHTSEQGLKVPPRKSTLFDDLDSLSTPRSSTKNGSSIYKIDDSSLTSLSDADFEDVPPATKRRKIQNAEDNDDEEDDDEDVEFEDVETPQIQYPDAPIQSGNLELTLIRDTRINLANALGKKGPSKLERKIRIATHCVHVQLLLWHNALRNSWLCDPLVQGIMLSHVPPRLMEEVDKWRKNSGLQVRQEMPEENPKGKPGPKGKPKGKGKGKAAARPPRERDWGVAARHLEQGAVDMSHGDPLFRLMKVLSSWWKQRFRVTAPGLRKWGYMSLERLDRLTKAFKQQDGNHDQDKYGERIQNLDEFRQFALDCTGSRDVGAQLFTALLRALGLDARLVASLQPLGFGWNKLEEADPEKEDFLNHSPRKGSNQAILEKPAKPRKATTVSAKANTKAPTRPSRRASTKITTDNLEFDRVDSDDELVIEVPPSPPRRARLKIYDTDLEFSHYWTEVLSPVTNKYLTVDPIVKSVIATNRELVESLEPRGGKADKAKQMMAYIVGYSQDGTAKDVTVRYLKRQVLPGRTKGNRIPIEKVPVYNRHGKVKRYDQFDWFKSAMKGYVRGDQKHPFTEADELEDSTDLKPAKAEKKEVKEGEETLQYYKQSKEFVLARHLKREEALPPDARPVKMFKNKGTKGGQAAEEPVYSRKDVVQVKSAETWHKQGRAPIPGQKPLKHVPYRAATTNRRREIAEAEAATGERVLQGLYGFDQTEWIIPPPIENGIIPKNEYGNIDLFVEHMCPRGAVHVPYRGAMRVAKRLGIDYAEAVVDFEFGHRMAVPVIQGVVVAAENHDRVMEELAKDEAEKARKADEKRRKAALGLWRKFLMGMRIVKRIRADYGDVEAEEVDAFGKGGSQKIGGGNADMKDGDGYGYDDLGGGFLPEGYEEEEEDEGVTGKTSGFFSVMNQHHEEEENGEGADGDDGDDVLEVDHGDVEDVSEVSEVAAATKRKSAMSTKPKRKTAGKKMAVTSRRRRRRNAPSSSDEDEEEEEDYHDDDDDDDEYEQ